MLNKCGAVGGIKFDRGNQTTWRKLLQCHLVHQKFHMTWPGAKPGSPLWQWLIHDITNILDIVHIHRILGWGYENRKMVLAWRYVQRWISVLVTFNFWVLQLESEWVGDMIIRSYSLLTVLAIFDIFSISGVSFPYIFRLSLHWQIFLFLRLVATDLTESRSSLIQNLPANNQITNVTDPKHMNSNNTVVTSIYSWFWDQWIWCQLRKILM
jgi:hypothetical protein